MFTADSHYNLPLPKGCNEIRVKVSVMQILQLHLKGTFRILRNQFREKKKSEALLALGGSSVEVYVLSLDTCFSLAKQGLQCNNQG